MGRELNDLAKDLGDRLRAGRTRANLSQAELAEQLGCSVRSIQDYEAGLSFPRPWMRRRILAFLREVEEAVA